VFDGDGNPLPVPAFDCAGRPVAPGAEFCVPFTDGGDVRHAVRDQAHPSIASDAQGGFIIVYDDDSGAGPDSLQKGIRARLYGPDAQAVATPLGSANSDCNPPPNMNMGPAPACCASATCDFQINTIFAPTAYTDTMRQCNQSPRNCYQVSPRVGMGDDGRFV